MSKKNINMIDKETIIELLSRTFKGYIFEVKIDIINKCNVLLINNISSKIKLLSNIDDVLNKEFKNDDDKKIISSLIKKVAFFIIGF